MADGEHRDERPRTPPAPKHERADERPRPEPAHDDPAHAERTWGSDQDIDTAGQVPGNKATDSKEPIGF